VRDTVPNTDRNCYPYSHYAATQPNAYVDSKFYVAAFNSYSNRFGDVETLTGSEVSAHTRAAPLAITCENQTRC
jgi:hypothetical protein